MRDWSSLCVVLLAAVCLCAVQGCDRRSDSDTVRVQRPLDTITTFGSLGDTPGKFAYPRAIDFDPIAGTIWVVDRSGRVQELDPNTGVCLTVFRMPDSELGFPVGITIAPGHNSAGQWTDRLIYLADTHYQRVVIVEPPKPLDAAERARVSKDPGSVQRIEPNIVRMHGSYGTGPGQFIYPTDVAVVADKANQRIERIYVSEYGTNDRVSVFDGQFRFLFSFGTFGSSASADSIQFNRPQAMMIDDSPAALADVANAPEQADPNLRNKRLVIVDARNHRIGLFTMGGELIRWIGDPDDPSDAPGHFRFPWGLALVGDGSALVCDFVGGRVQRVDLQSGQGTASWGKAGVRDGELNSPWALLRLSDRRVIIVDGRNNRLQVFRGP